MAGIPREGGWGKTEGSVHELRGGQPLDSQRVKIGPPGGRMQVKSLALFSGLTLREGMMQEPPRIQDLK